MCCGLDPIYRGNFFVTKVVTVSNSQKEKYLVEGILDRSPATFRLRIVQGFRKLEGLEKCAELADQFFHLGGSTLQKFSSLKVYQALRNLHHAAHDVEHFLHAFCFFNDLS